MVNTQPDDDIEYELGDLVMAWMKEKLMETLVELREFLNSLGVVLVLDEDAKTLNEAELTALLEEGIKDVE